MATDINHVVLVGRLTRDAELKYTNTGFAVAKFSIAVNERRKKDDQWVEDVSFFDAVAWGRMAEALAQYLVKGKQIAVQGQLRQNRWEQDGQSRSKVEVNCATIQLLGGRSSAPTQDTGHPAQAPAEDTGSSDDFEDDIPF